MIGTGLLVTVLWESPSLYPVKVLAVLVHEIWHAIVAMLSGAMVDRIILHPDEGGETLVRGMKGGIGFILTVSAGYLGTTFTGALFINRGVIGNLSRPLLALFSATLIYFSYLFTDPGSIAFYTGMGWGILLLIPLFSGLLPVSYALTILGTLFVWYSFYDTFDFTEDVHRTDAGILANYFVNHYNGVIPNFMRRGLANSISALWVIIMVIMVYSILRYVINARAFSDHENPEEQKKDGQNSSHVDDIIQEQPVTAVLPSADPDFAEMMAEIDSLTGDEKKKL